MENKIKGLKECFANIARKQGRNTSSSEVIKTLITTDMPCKSYRPQALTLKSGF